MKPKIYQYGFGGLSYLAIIKNECFIDIACSANAGIMFGKININVLSEKEKIKTQAKDLALYTHCTRIGPYTQKSSGTY
jgi:hypothetical protein